MYRVTELESLTRTLFLSEPKVAIIPLCCKMRCTDLSKGIDLLVNAIFWYEYFFPLTTYEFV
jgi:hypothetical protein